MSEPLAATPYAAKPWLALYTQDLPKRIATDLAASLPVMRYLAGLPGLEEGSPAWLR